MKRCFTASAVFMALALFAATASAQGASGRRPAPDRTPTGRAATPRSIPAPRDTPVVRPAQPPSPARRVAMPRQAALRVQGAAGTELRAWNDYVEQRLIAGTLRSGRTMNDPSLPHRTIERFQAFHRDVPVWGAEIVRDSDGGVPQAIFGEVLPDFVLDTRPLVTADAAERRVLTIAGAGSRVLQRASLTVLPRAANEQPRLAYVAVAAATHDVIRLFIDAVTGDELLRYSEIHTQAAVGSGRGVLGDNKKLSVLQQGSQFLADDQHRPPVLTTFDFRNSVPRIMSVTFNGAPLFASDIASDADNTWTDPAVIDAHVHVGWTYDYLFKRFGRRGLDDRDRPIAIFTNASSQIGVLSLTPPEQSLWALNAFWCNLCGPGSAGVLFFGNGIPPGFFVSGTGNNYNYFAGALDIAAHELAHGVTDSSSGLIYLNESGALNESFSDIIGTSTEFYWHPPGTGPGRADYVMGEDISRALAPGSRDGDRSLQSPALHNQPDHYSLRFTGTLDNGGVHINSGIPNHAFYLAIEGGVNRISGLAVQGVGAANREQIERVFYRAFVFLLPSSATFSTARAATIQAARDLYGVNSAAERAVTDAWTAVGVQ